MTNSMKDFIVDMEYYEYSKDVIGEVFGLYLTKEEYKSMMFHTNNQELDYMELQEVYEELILVN